MKDSVVDNKLKHLMKLINVIKLLDITEVSKLVIPFPSQSRIYIENIQSNKIVNRCNKIILIHYE